jgi:hypothetical protein
VKEPANSSAAKPPGLCKPHADDPALAFESQNTSPDVPLLNAVDTFPKTKPQQTASDAHDDLEVFDSDGLETLQIDFSHPFPYAAGTNGNRSLKSSNPHNQSNLTAQKQKPVFTPIENTSNILRLYGPVPKYVPFLPPPPLSQSFPSNLLQSSYLPYQTAANHAVEDYQIQLMLLEQQNKKRLLMARQEQDNALQMREERDTQKTREEIEKQRHANVLKDLERSRTVAQELEKKGEETRQLCKIPDFFTKDTISKDLTIGKQLELPKPSVSSRRDSDALTARKNFCLGVEEI